MLAKCLQNFIGASQVCSNFGMGASTSGLYLTDLEGISINRIANIVNGEDGTALNLLNRKIEFSTGLVFDDLAKYIQPYYTLNRTLDVVTAGRYTTTFLTPTPLRRGLHIKRKERNLYSVKINTVKIFSSTSLTGAILRISDGIYDNDYVVDIVANQILEVVVNYTTIFDEVYITLDNTLLTVNEGNLGYTDGCGGCCSCGYSSNNLAHKNKKINDISVKGWNGVSDEQRSFGLVAELSVGCDFDRLQCVLADNFKYLLLYRAGIEVVKEWLSSERVNETTMIDTDHAIFLLERWEKEYDTKYRTAVKGIKGIMESLDSQCVTCKKAGYGYSW